MISSIVNNLLKSKLPNVLVTSRQTLITKTPTSNKKTWMKFARGFLLIEIGFFVGCYLVWKRMNNSQEFRFYMKQNWPTILEGYYLNGEMLGNLNTRNFDKECWEKQRKDK